MSDGLSDNMKNALFGMGGPLESANLDTKFDKYTKIEFPNNTTILLNKIEDQQALQGIKHDANKVRMELLPVTPLVDIAKVLTFGAKKYSDENWRKGISYKRVYGALLRHLTSWYSGEENDSETGESHLAHAGCCLLFLLEYTHTKTEFDDRYKGDK